MAHPGEITLVPIGPLTNVALALRLEPRLVENVKEIVLMGGAALCSGNVNPAAEANIYNDPEAADVVFSAGWPVTMVGLDVTLKVNMTPEHLAIYGQSDKATSQHIAKTLPVYQRFIRAFVASTFMIPLPLTMYVIRRCSPQSPVLLWSRLRASAGAKHGSGHKRNSYRPGKTAHW